jgi:tetratricopeptide (TPR) repeat protein
VTLHTGQRRLSQLALSPSGRWLATGDWEGGVRLWDLAEARRQLKGANLDWDAPPLPPSPPEPQGAARTLEVARRHHLHGQVQEAVQAYGQALAQGSADAAVYRDRGEALLQLNRLDDALADFTKARQLAPDQPLNELRARALEARGEAHADAGRLAGAAADFAAVMDLGEPDQTLWEHLGLTLVATGDLDGYRKFCARLMKQYGDDTDPTTANALAWACVFAPRPVPDGERLVALARRAVADDPQNSNVLNTLGAVLCRVGQADEAVRRLREGMRLQAQGGTGWDYVFLALAEHQRGHADEARKAREQADAWFEKALHGRPQSWGERLQMELLRREAQTLLGDKDPPKKR